MLREIDSIHRIVIPKEITDNLSINYETPLNIYMKNNEIIIEGGEESCAYCGTSLNILNNIKIHNKSVCKNCMQKIINLV